MEKLKNVHELYDQILSLAVAERLRNLMSLLESEELDLDTFCAASEEVTIWKCFLREHNFDIPLEVRIALLHY